MAIPIFAAVNASGEGGVGSISVPWPNPHQIDDIGILACETRSLDFAPAAPSGWTEFPGSPQNASVGTFPSRLSVFWKRATSGAEPDVSLPDAGNHIFGVIAVVRGCITTGDPFNVQVGATEIGNNTTTCNFPGATTTVDECLILLIASRGNDSTAGQFSSWTNSNPDLTGISEPFDGGTSAGDGGGVVIGHGNKAVAGTFGTTTVTVTNNLIHGQLTVAMRPPLGGPSTQTLTQDSTIASGVELFAPNVQPGPYTMEQTTTIASAEAVYEPALYYALPQESGAFIVRVSHVRQGATQKSGLGITWLSPPTIASAEAVYAPTVTQPVGTQTITAEYVPTAEVIFTPTLTQIIALPEISSAEALHLPTVTTGVWNINIPAIASAEALHVPTLTLSPYTLTAAHVATGEAFHPPTVAPSLLQSLTINTTIASGEVVFTPTITGGTQLLTPPVLASGEALYAPTVWPAPWPVTAATVPSGLVLYAPSVSYVLTLPTITTGQAFYAPTITRSLGLPLLGSGEAFYGPTLTPGPVTLVLVDVSSGLIIYTGGVAIVLYHDSPHTAPVYSDAEHLVGALHDGH